MGSRTFLLISCYLSLHSPWPIACQISKAKPVCSLLLLELVFPFKTNEMPKVAGHLKKKILCDKLSIKLAGTWFLSDFRRYLCLGLVLMLQIGCQKLAALWSILSIAIHCSPLYSISLCLLQSFKQPWLLRKHGGGGRQWALCLHGQELEMLS